MKKVHFLSKNTKKKLNKKKIIWISKIDKIKKIPTIFIANEFFDSLAIKQFKKNKNLWFEKFVKSENEKKFFYLKKKLI